MRSTCADIIDLTDPQVRVSWSVARNDLACAWKLLEQAGDPVPTWLLVERLRAAGSVGVMVRSFAPGSAETQRNLVFWTWNDELPYSVKMIDNEGRLPLDDSSWRSRS